MFAEKLAICKEAGYTGVEIERLTGISLTSQWAITNGKMTHGPQGAKAIALDKLARRAKVRLKKQSQAK